MREKKPTAKKATPKEKPPNRAGGQPTKLTPKVQEIIIKALEDGNHYKTALSLANISQDTGREWIERGRGLNRERPSTPLYVAFAQAVERARSVAEDRAIACVKEAIAGKKGKKTRKLKKTITGRTDMKGNPLPDIVEITEEEIETEEQSWQAATWFLENGRSERWGGDRLDMISAAKTLAENDVLPQNAADKLVDGIEKVEEELKAALKNGNQSEVPEENL